MLEGFEVLAPERGKRASARYITFTPAQTEKSQSWHVRLNTAASEAVSAQKNVKVLHNPATKEVAICAAQEDDPMSLKITWTGKVCAFSGSQLARVIGVTPERRKFPLELREGVLFFSYA